jgi:2-amino-4-hydroxy-6-hydroxymethyldihydropteridine diphosphokinase
MSHALVGLGSNLGDRRSTIDRAIAALVATPDTRLLARSNFHETAPVGGPSGQASFLNAAATFETSLSPSELLARLAQIEIELGRDRAPNQVRWQARTLDLDLLLYDEQVIDTPTLVVPHPRMAFRRFVLEPAAEIAADWRHPTIGWTIGKLLAHLNRAKPYLAITGPPGAGKTRLAEIVAPRVGAQFLADPVDSTRLAAFYADPSGLAGATEIEFVSERRKLLAAHDWSAAEPAVVSDFWIGQSLAYATVWQSDRERASLADRWREAQAEVALPKILVALDAPTEALAERIQRRGRSYEQGLGIAELEQLRAALVAEASRAGLGPVLRLSSADDASPETEVLAAWQASR